MLFTFFAAIGSRGEQARGASRPALVVRRVLGALRAGACTFSRDIFALFFRFLFFRLTRVASIKSKRLTEK
jgi:hypothetical protein